MKIRRNIQIKQPIVAFDFMSKTLDDLGTPTITSGRKTDRKSARKISSKFSNVKSKNLITQQISTAAIFRIDEDKTEHEK